MKQIKFQYSLSYLSQTISKHIHQSFEKWFSEKELEYQTKFYIILDGQNLVDNVARTPVITTDRVLRLQDNRSLNKLAATETLRCLLRVNEVVIIPEPPGDSNGHAHGLVMSSTDDNIFLIKTDETLHCEIIDEFKSSFSAIQIIVIPNYIQNSTWTNFTSAQNRFVNSIATDK